MKLLVKISVSLLIWGLFIVSVMIGPKGEFADINVSGIRMEGLTPNNCTIVQQLWSTLAHSIAKIPILGPSTLLIYPSKNLDLTIAKSAPTFSETDLSKFLGPSAAPLA